MCQLRQKSFRYVTIIYIITLRVPYVVMCVWAVGRKYLAVLYLEGGLGVAMTLDLNIRDPP